MEQITDLLFITFFLEQLKPEFEVHCCGCREIIIPEYKTPVHIMGLIKSEEKFIPVIDPSIWYRGEPTRVTTSACILIVKHSYEYRQLQTGILIGDIEELMNMMAGGYKNHIPKGTSFNVRFVCELDGNNVASNFLANTHIKLNQCLEKKNSEDDFAFFKEIVLRGLAYA